MKRFGLIGTSIRSSYSKCIHESISDNKYELIQLDNTYYVDEFLLTDFNGINVTRPYKSYLIDKMDKLSEIASKIGVLNTVIKDNGKLYGYNTDAFGFEWLLLKEKIDVLNKNCVVFGTGSTSKTVAYVLKNNGAKSIKFLSRNPDNQNSFSYDNKEVLEGAEILVNTTPTSLNRFSKNELIDFNLCKKATNFIDVNYRPMITNLMWSANECGIKTCNGLRMLVAQAIKTQELFLDRKFDDEYYDYKYKEVLKKITNISIIGHPFSGKSTIGKLLAVDLNKHYFDIDEEIESTLETTIPEIFEKHGEEYFRYVESNVLKTIMNANGSVISTGGGIILNEENIRILKMGSKVINIQRDPNLVSAFLYRPLCKSKEDLEKLIKERKEIYESVSLKTITNNGDFQSAVKEIEDSLWKYL